MQRRYNRRRAEALSERGRRMANARWAADRARRDAEEPVRLLEMALAEARNLPCREGDAVGILEWTDLREGQKRRWVIRIGDRADRYTAHSPDGRHTPPRGLTWLFNKLRSRILRG